MLDGKVGGPPSVEFNWRVGMPTCLIGGWVILRSTCAHLNTNLTKFILEHA